ncbi:hypothetical protein GCM10022279_29610 [Comamonas faecalis]|uniref:Crp/Fnr family transcriptional regulator n=2 Tax=Comamonas faecalis TaxID=1387849 RepID=A0ABP7RXV9_9BURK
MLDSLSDDRLAQLATQCRWHRLEAEQELVGPYVDDRLYFLVHGGLRVASYAASGKGMVLGDLAAGLFFGGLRVAEAEDAPAPMRFPVTVQATQDSLVASLAHEDVEALLMNEVGVLRAVIAQLSTLAQVLATRVLNLGTLSVRARLHAQLLELVERSAQDTSGNQAVLQPAPRQSDLALMLGSSREEVAREMSRLTRLGLLRRQGRALQLCNLEGLRLLLEEAR